MEPTLPPIPTSKEVRSRDFRTRLLPIIVFGVVFVFMFLLWALYVSAPVLVGQVEPISTYVNSPKTGVVSDMNLTRLQDVKAGDEVGRIIITDPKVLETSLAVIKSEIALLKVNLEPEMAEQRYSIQFDRLRLDAMEQRVELAATRVKAQQAEKDLRRAQSLQQGKIVSDSAFEQTKMNYDKLVSEVGERTKLVDDMEKSLGTHRIRDDVPGATVVGPQDVLSASIAVQEAKLKQTEAELSPIILRAPVDGVVSVITRHNGETVTPGEAIATITAHTSDHIVGYIRQPIAIHVAAGMKVEIQARSFNRPIGSGTITQVGSQLEPISPALVMTPNAAQAPVLGLPLDITLPAGMKLVPGEVVDLALR